jgi:hypothetical protein
MWTLGFAHLLPPDALRRLGPRLEIMQELKSAFAVEALLAVIGWYWYYYINYESIRCKPKEPLKDFSLAIVGGIFEVQQPQAMQLMIFLVLA